MITNMISNTKSILWFNLKIPLRTCILKRISYFITETDDALLEYDVSNSKV